MKLGRARRCHFGPKSWIFGLKKDERSPSSTTLLVESELGRQGVKHENGVGVGVGLGVEVAFHFGRLVVVARVNHKSQVLGRRLIVFE